MRFMITNEIAGGEFFEQECCVFRKRIDRSR